MPESGATDRSQLLVGASVALLGSGMLGIETDFAYGPRFFESDNRAGNVLSSRVITWHGSVIAAPPLSVTRESLRPYLTGGLGLNHAGINDLSGVFSVSDTSLAMNAGGGVIGLVSPRTGVRFEVRQFRSLQRDANALNAIRNPRLGFWRATIGVILRY